MMMMVMDLDSIVLCRRLMDLYVFLRLVAKKSVRRLEDQTPLMPPRG